MSWIEEMNDDIFNKNTIVKPWKAEQFIALFEYLIKNGVEEFAKFSSETEKFDISEQNYLRMLEVYQWCAISPTKEKWKELLELYPNIKKFLEANDMLDRRMLCSGLYFESLFNQDLSRNLNIAKTFLNNMKKIEYLNADICWSPIGVSPFSHDANGQFPWLSQVTYDVTDENEKMIFLKKYYCGLDLEYHLVYSYYTEKNGRRYRHDVYSFEYEKANQDFNIEQAAGHGWILQVINNGKHIKKMMVLQGFRITNILDHKCHNLPSLEEVEKLDLTDEMKKYKTDKELTKMYLKRLKG